MAIARSWLRISGLLWEDLTFEPDVGWETDTIAARPPEGEGPWTVSLHDEAGTVLALARPEVRFVDPGGVRAMRRARVVAYLPLRSGARELRLAREHQVLHTQPVSPFRPKVEVSSLEVEDGTVHLAWTALHPDPAAGRLSFRVVYAAPGRGVFPVADELTAPWLTVPLARLPGSRGGRLAVLATDGVRSAVDVSEAFAVPTRPARVAILQPAHGTSLPADQPLSARGVAHDDAGRRLPARGLVWTVDGEEVARGTRLPGLGALPAGSHRLGLRWEGDEAPHAEVVHEVTVAARKVPKVLEELPPSAPRGKAATLRIKL